MTDLKCPYCDLKISIHIPDDVSPEELKMIKTCSCGKMMETAEETEKRIRRRSETCLLSSGEDNEEYQWSDCIMEIQDIPKDWQELDLD